MRLVDIFAVGTTTIARVNFVKVFLANMALQLPESFRAFAAPLATPQLESVAGRDARAFTLSTAAAPAVCF